VLGSHVAPGSGGSHPRARHHECKETLGPEARVWQLQLMQEYIQGILYVRLRLPALRCGSGCRSMIAAPVKSYTHAAMQSGCSRCQTSMCHMQRAPCNVAEGHRLLTDQITECVPRGKHRSRLDGSCVGSRGRESARNLLNPSTGLQRPCTADEASDGIDTVYQVCPHSVCTRFAGQWVRKPLPALLQLRHLPTAAAGGFRAGMLGTTTSATWQCSGEVPAASISCEQQQQQQQQGDKQQQGRDSQPHTDLNISRRRVKQTRGQH
jgi:hypothetical protein